MGTVVVDIYWAEEFGLALAATAHSGPSARGTRRVPGTVRADGGEGGGR